jgi:hypothetical protein
MEVSRVLFQGTPFSLTVTSAAGAGLGWAISNRPQKRRSGDQQFDIGHILVVVLARLAVDRAF